MATDEECPSQHLVAYTVSQGKYINVAAFDTKRELEGTPFPHGKWVADVPTQEAVDAYSGFEPEAMALLQVLSSHRFVAALESL